MKLVLISLLLFFFSQDIDAECIKINSSISINEYDDEVELLLAKINYLKKHIKKSKKPILKKKKSRKHRVKTIKKPFVQNKQLLICESEISSIERFSNDSIIIWKKSTTMYIED